ncbi:DUF1707 and DUF4190 domain-containing protein [Streptomyces bullii]|uniref:DUF1707 and DUF4190 domain-containing protein n=1 Tax=Streptomyces bullii TaxID=349910 RepID=A0ABW0V074_9ACTN
MSQSSYPSWQPWQEGQGGVPQPVPQPGVHPQAWVGHGVPSMLASHADRERAVDVLRAGFGEGRLEKGEFDKRVARAYAARTVGELALLVADLPQGPVPQPVAALQVPRTFLPVPRPQTNGKAVGAAVCGLLCVPTFGLTGIPAIVLGHAARSEISRTGEGGDGLAMTGLVLGWMYTAGWALVLVFLTMVSALVG